MKKYLSILMLLLSTSAMAEAPKPGAEFDAVAQPITTDVAGKIEVMEVFWYGCIHCYQMEAPLNAWVKKLPADVYFKRMPALPRADWAPMAKAFFAMETLGVSEKLHAPLFEAVHKQKTLNPTDEKAAIEWVTKASGLDKLKVEQAFKSFTINTNLNRAAQIFRASGATGVPSLVIDGQYITSSTMSGGNAEALKVADYIIDNVRKAKATQTTKAPAAKK
ncbi:MAG: disulfide bond formation protein DsbA [Methylotenera sp.]|nr:thiol:disulfide interchange protein DsbA/DsbL [Methylotenera sp.]PPC87843.1 MAG: disulfide bond formation protein DsbA [Methylotenera sp.]PPD17980.1 MAG: disulfide bond formation protein DsbA [Methylotenera sp.]